jgi:hypothetical protein
MGVLRVHACRFILSVLLYTLPGRESVVYEASPAESLTLVAWQRIVKQLAMA